jgi:hypothetical protein
VEETDDPGVFHTNIGWIDAGSWYRYTFYVPQAGWVKFEFRVACAGGGTLAGYWDETLVGTVSFATGNWHIMTWGLMEDEIETTTGVHTLRVKSVADGINFDAIAIQWNAAAPSRKSVWEDNFDSYTTTADVFSPTVGKWTRGNTTNSAGSWTLWDPEGPDLGTVPTADIAGMEDKFMKNYRAYEDPDHTQTAEVDIRSFDAVSGWGNWTNLLHLDTSSVPVGLDPPILSDPEVFDLSAYDGKKIQLRFHFFNAEYDYWFAVDNIRVSAVKPPETVPLPTIEPGPGAGMLTLNWLHFDIEQYVIEFTSDLTGTWQPIAGPISEAAWSGAMPAGQTGFYRVRNAE